MHGTSEDDGRLTVEEIFGSDIQGRLVTLSACETGLGELGQGDELVGLSRAFLYAGAPAVVVSLWKVDDSTTAWLMTRLHQYLHAGHRVPEALTYAQRDLININMKVQKSSSRGIGEEVFDPKIVEAVSKRKASRMPYFWSPFVVIGSAL